jgi:cation diffusion facilitator CzcD-associated flavoprotein CzcO
VDVLVVGGGLSGVGAGCHLEMEAPQKSYAILEARATTGGTWDLFRYPGIRSDSDMYTLGFPFQPWDSNRAIVDGPSIRQYIRDTARQYGVEGKIRLNHRVTRARWSTADQRWTVEVERTDTGERLRLTCQFLFMCSGYYRYDQPYDPEFAGREDFGGTIVHPQFWPEDLDYSGRRVIVIGSGATAVTLVPAMAEHAAHVTMLQRSPSYVVSLPGEDPVAKLARRVLPVKAAYSLVRWKNVLVTMLVFWLSRNRPHLVKRLIRGGLERNLPEGYDIDRHFKPSYNPWDQRMCLVPDSDLFEAIGQGKASVVTDHIDRITPTGVRLASGQELETDVIVTATGLNLLALGGLEFEIDGRPVDLPQAMIYRGCMLSGVPNLAFAFGYTNASWTLKCDLTCEYVTRILNYMDQRGYTSAVPTLGHAPIQPVDFVDFTSGYVQRSIHLFPKQGSQPPWRLYQNYVRDRKLIRKAPLEDGVLRFASGDPGQAPADPRAVATAA